MADCNCDNIIGFKEFVPELKGGRKDMDEMMESNSFNQTFQTLVVFF